MSRTSLALAGASVMTLAVLVARPGLAEATDLCVNVGPSQIMAVGKGFTVPASGKCKPFSGYVPLAASTVSGVGCTSTDGAHLYLSLTRTFIGSLVVVDEVSLSRHDLTGTVREAQLTPSSGFGSSVGASAAKCIAPPLP